MLACSARSATQVLCWLQPKLASPNNWSKSRTALVITKAECRRKMTLSTLLTQFLCETLCCMSEFACMGQGFSKRLSVNAILQSQNNITDKSLFKKLPLDSASRCDWLPTSFYDFPCNGEWPSDSSRIQRPVKHMLGKRKPVKALLRNEFITIMLPMWLTSKSELRILRLKLNLVVELEISTAS